MATVELMDRQEPTWKSPLRKLARFFGRSRDRWKAKYAALKKAYKLMVNQVRAVEKSREKWKQDAKQAQQQLCRLQQELEELKNSLAA
jgi:chromosome segregation ATPase